MPSVDIRAIARNDAELTILARIVLHGRIRKSRPPTSDVYGCCAAYVWRMVVFCVSPNPQHHCMPVMAEFYLPGSASERRELMAVLDKLADRVIDAIPVTMWHGIRRWASVL